MRLWLFHILAIIAFVAPLVSGRFGSFNESSTWDEFVNNFATDLAPIVALFGEQVTKQFLSESTTIFDSIIFAMAPIGIITTVVSVIRLYGTPSLKAIIGRAQEPQAQAEMELCSSTSDDVCELWSNGGICRVYGRPRFLEFIYIKPKDSSEYYPTIEEGRNDMECEVKPATCGIHLPRELFKNVASESSDVESNNSAVASSEAAKHWRMTDPDGRLVDIFFGRKNKTQTKVVEEDFAPHPNLALNIGMQKAAAWRLPTAALFGVSLQASVLGYAVWANWYHPAFSQGSKDYGATFFILYAIGTALLVLGMGLCARLIDGQSQELVFVTTKAERMFWLQPGNQRIGDQAFDAFAHTDKMTEFITSRRDKPQQQQSPPFFLFSIALALLGWAVQFIGLRGLHGTVSLFQFLATIIMAFVRGILRGKRLDADKNNLGHDLGGVEGHELDWQAFNIFGQCLCEQKSNGYGIYFLLVDDHTDQAYRGNVPAIIKEECLTRCTYGSHGIVYSFNKGDQGLKRLLLDVQGTAESWETSIESPLPKDGRVFLVNASPNKAAQLIYVRSRLAALTNKPYLKHDQPWRINVRRAAVQLKQVLEETAAYMFSPNTSPEDWPYEIYMDAMCWSIKCQTQDGAGSNTPLANQITVSILRSKGKWEIDQNQLEAILGLWSWSLRCLIQASSNNRPDPQQDVLEDPFFKTKRLIVDSLRLDATVSLLQSWVTRNLNPPQRDIEKGRKSLLSVPSACSIFLNLSALERHYGLISVDAESSVIQLMAQDIFTVFLTRATSVFSPTFDPMEIERNSRFHILGGLIRIPYVERLANILLSAQLATQEEALMSIIPVVSEASILPSHHLVFFSLLSRANRLRMHQQFIECEGILRDLLGLQIAGLEATLMRAFGRLCLAKCYWTLQNPSEVTMSELFEFSSGLIPRLLRELRLMKPLSWRGEEPLTPDQLAMVEIWLQYDTIARWLVSNWKALSLHDTALEPFHLPPGGPDHMEQKPIEESHFNRHLRMRVEQRKYVLRWALEFGFPELVESLWTLEKLHGLDGSAFTGGADEVFWAINGEYLPCIKLDIVHFLLTVVESSVLPSSHQCYHCDCDRNREEEDAGQSSSATTDMCESHIGWKHSKRWKDMHRNYRKYGTALVAAVSQPGNLHMIKLLVELGKSKICAGLCRNNHALMASMDYGEFETFRFLILTYIEREVRGYGYGWYDSEDTADEGLDFYMAIEYAVQLGRADCFQLLIQELQLHIGRQKQKPRKQEFDYTRVERAVQSAPKDDPTTAQNKAFQSDPEGLKKIWESFKRENSAKDNTGYV